MDRSKVFCNVPWFEVHINANGTYHSCGAQPNPMLFNTDGEKYNVFNMSINDWVNSDYQCRARLSKLQGKHDNLCRMCYHEESHGSSSKRHKELHKSHIAINQFEDTFDSSPDRHWFDYSLANNGKTDYIMPTSYHISLGNECNLACKFCSPHASSKVAVERIAEGSYQGTARMNWTEDSRAWTQVSDYICRTENLQFVHIIGGEPLINPQFENLIDKLIAAGNTNIYLGFTTNGTILNHSLFKKLDQFRHVDIGISVETADQLNNYIRKGGDTKIVLDNIKEYSNYISESHVYVTVRPVPCALSVHTLDGLYQWCIDHKIDVMTNLLTWPACMQIENLPSDIKEKLLKQYSSWKFSEPEPGNWNPRDPTRYKDHIDNGVRAIISALQRDNDPELTRELYTKLNNWGWLDDPYTSKFFKTDFR